MNKKVKIVNENLSKSVIESIVDGDGIRLAIFFQGCKHNCKNCHNPSTWSFDAGYNCDIDKLVDYVSEKLNKYKYYSGITLTGGDPLYQISEVNLFVEKLKEKSPQVNIWCYTGFTYEEIKDVDLIKNIDVLVDGLFVESLKNISLRFKGSENQRILYLKNGNIVKTE